MINRFKIMLISFLCLGVFYSCDDISNMSDQLNQMKDTQNQILLQQDKILKSLVALDKSVAGIKTASNDKPTPPPITIPSQIARKGFGKDLIK